MPYAHLRYSFEGYRPSQTVNLTYPGYTNFYDIAPQSLTGEIPLW